MGGLRNPSKSMLQRMPVRVALIACLPFTPAMLSIAIWVIAEVQPGVVDSICLDASGLSSGILNLFVHSVSDRDGLPVERLAIDNLVLSFGLLNLLTALVIMIVSTIEYKNSIGSWIDYRFGKSVEDWYQPFRRTAPVGSSVAILAVMELLVGGNTMRFLEFHASGDPLSLEQFLIRAGAYFTVVGAVLVSGLQIMMFRLLGRNSVKRRPQDR